MNIPGFTKGQKSQSAGKSASAQAALSALIDTARDIVNDASIDEKVITIGTDIYHVEYADERLRLPGLEEESVPYVRWSAISGVGGRKASHSAHRLAAALSVIDLKHQLTVVAPDALELLSEQCLRDLERSLPTGGVKSFMDALPLLSLLKKNYEVSEHASFTLTEVLQSIMSRDPGQLLTHPAVSKLMAYFRVQEASTQADPYGQAAAPSMGPSNMNQRPVF